MSSFSSIEMVLKAMSDDALVTVALCASGAILLVVAVGAVLVIRDTVRQAGKWGINFKPVSCPLCAEPCPTVRAPKSLRQALWGGATCAACGAEIDKWGKLVAPAADAPARREKKEINDDEG
jgi:hypothetical protein